MTRYMIYCVDAWREVGEPLYHNWHGRKRIRLCKRVNRCRRNALWFWAEDYTDYQALPNRG